MFQLAGDLAQRQRAMPGGGQLDGEGCAVQQPADIGDVAGVVRSGLEVGAQAADAGQKEGGGAVVF